MMTTVPIILVIVVWLFILAPMLLRSQRPMSHTGEAFEETRVLFEGDSGEVAGRRKPRLGKGDVRARSNRAAEAEENYELVSADEVDSDAAKAARNTDGAQAGAEETIEGELVTSGDVDTTNTTNDADGADGAAGADSKSSGAEKSRTVGAPQAERVKPIAAATAHDAADDADDEDEDDLIVDDEPTQLVDGADAETADSAAAGDVDAVDAEVFTIPAGATVAEDAYDLDDSYTSPVDLMYPGAVDAEEEKAGAENEADDAAASTAEGSAVPVSADSADEDSTRDVDSAENTELSAEEVAFAQRRLGRGGWDPVKEKEASATRYQRRQRTLIGLAVAVVATVALGIVVGGWTWWLAAIAGVITVVYLVALRAQVRREQELLRQRVYHLRRARLGVRHADNPAETLPRNLRRPGALVLEIDDESPDFDYLPVHDGDDTDGGFDGPHASSRQRRDDLAARRVG